MCEFLTGPDNNDRKQIAELKKHLSIERHAADALFRAMSDQADTSIDDDKKLLSYRSARDLYSKLLQGRSNGDFNGIVDDAHKIMGEQ